MQSQTGQPQLITTSTGRSVLLQVIGNGKVTTPVPGPMTSSSDASVPGKVSYWLSITCPLCQLKPLSLVSCTLQLDSFSTKF